MPYASFAAAALAIAFVTAAVAATPIPEYASAALADKSRPAEDVARDPARKPAEMIVFAGIKPGDKVVDLIQAKVISPGYSPRRSDRRAMSMPITLAKSIHS